MQSRKFTLAVTVKQNIKVPVSLLKQLCEEIGVEYENMTDADVKRMFEENAELYANTMLVGIDELEGVRSTLLFESTEMSVTER
jgi:hypothetical protein